MGFKSALPLVSLKQKARHQTVEARVMLLMTLDEQCGSDDRRLLRLYLKEFHNIETLEQYEANKNAPSVETLRRTRQKIQERRRV